MRARIKNWNKLYKKDELNIKDVKLSLYSWKAHIKHANSYNLYNNYLKKIDFEI